MRVKLYHCVNGSEEGSYFVITGSLWLELYTHRPQENGYGTRNDHTYSNAIIHPAEHQQTHWSETNPMIAGCSLATNYCNKTWTIATHYYLFILNVTLSWMYRPLFASTNRTYYCFLLPCVVIGTKGSLLDGHNYI